MSTDVIVTSEWLSAHLRSPGIRIVEASWSPPTGNVEHIPGAVLLDLRRCVRGTPLIPRHIPETDCLESAIRDLGVDSDTTVVIYDRESMFEAARLWWTLHLFGHRSAVVLDGGLKAWKAEGLPVDTGNLTATAARKGNFTAKAIDTRLIRNFTQMVDNINTKERQVVDTRFPEHFEGSKEEPSPSTVKALEAMNQPLPGHMLRGHITGSRSVPWRTVLDASTGRLFDQQQLRHIFDEAKVDLRCPLTMTCYTGNTACLVALAAVYCGSQDVAVYSGSWTEFGQIADPSHVSRGPPGTVVSLPDSCTVQANSVSTAAASAAGPHGTWALTALVAASPALAASR